MDIDGAAALAFRTGAAMDMPDLVIDDIFRDCARNNEHLPLLMTLVVAEPQIIVFDTAEQDRRPAITA
jgi:hypothetical protein